MEFNCDLNCPARVSPKLCCTNCFESKRYYKNKNNEKYWTDDDGFWGKKGCKLPRKTMPKECKEYDCRKYTWVFVRKWINGAWRDLAGIDIPENKKVIGIETGEKNKWQENKYWNAEKNKWEKC